MAQDTKRRMLMVFAHPDDESFGMAGTIARYVAEGVEVGLICATNGDVGTVAPEFMEGHGSVAELRLAELQCAANALKLAKVYTFGYRDSGMAGSDDNNHPFSLAMAGISEVAGRIVAVIREFRPQVVVTFDAFGGYGHPDHLVCHDATVRAFDAAGDPAQYLEQLQDGMSAYSPQKLYFSTFDRKWLRVFVKLMPLFGTNPQRFGRNQDVNLEEIAAFESPIHARINTTAYQEVAQHARQCHASQLGGMGPRRLSERLTRLFFGVRDTYTRSFPSANSRLRESDLFAGILGD